MSDDHLELGKSILDEMLEETEQKEKKKNLLKKGKAALGARWRKLKKGYLKYRKEVMEEEKSRK